jgi:hypothetical protein
MYMIEEPICPDDKAIAAGAPAGIAAIYKARVINIDPQKNSNLNAQSAEQFHSQVAGGRVDEEIKEPTPAPDNVG